MKRLPITGNYPVVGSLCTSIELCIHINADARFQFNCYAVIPDGDLLNPEYSCAMKSHFRKFGNQMSGSGNHDGVKFFL